MLLKHKLAAIAFAAGAILGCAGDLAVAPAEPAFAVTAGQILIQENFDDADFASRGWYDNAAMATSTAQHISGSTRALEAHFLPGAATPTWGGAARHLFTATPTLYVSYWVKYSDNWIGSGQAYHPHELLVLSDMDGDWDGPSVNWLTAYIEHNYQNGGIPRLALQDNKAINTASGALPNNLTAITENRSVSGCNGVVEPNVVATCFNMPPWYNGKELSAPQVWFQPNAGPGYKGDWNHVEVYFQMNSIVAGKGVPDGVAQYWFNGAPVIDRHDILFRTGARPNLQFHQFMIAPYIGDGSPVDQTMWIDDITVGTGSAVTPPPPPPPPPAAVVASVAVTPATASLALGATSQLAATPKDSAGNVLSGQAITWSSSNAAVASVSAGGLVTALTAGSATITAASGGQSGSAAISVAVAPVASVVVSPASANVAVGATRQLSATLKSASGATLTGRSITWASSAPAVASVSAAGMVTAVSTGSATIMATSEGKSGASAITVTAVKPSAVSTLKVVSVTDNSVTLSFTEVNDGSGRPASYQVRFRAGTLSWGSGTDVANGTCKVPMGGTSIGAVRTCTVLGLAAAKAYQFQLVAFRGTLNVNAVFGALSNKVSGTTTAATTPPPPPPAPVATVSVSPASANLAVAATQQLTVTLKDANGNTLTGRAVTWASNAPLGASVSANGLVTALAAGAATITATSEGMSGSAAMTVTASVDTNPGTVSDLAVAGVTDTSVTLSFTEVTGGAGLPASYDVRFGVGSMSWGSAPSVTNGTCRAVLAGTTIGAKRTCTVLGLVAGTAYQFEVVGFRGTLNLDAVFGGLSNVASGTTTSSVVPPPPPPPSAGWTHEPAGLTAIRDDNWEGGLLGSWFRKFTSGDKPITIVPITDSPIGEGQALQIGYNAGHVGGGGTELEYDIPSALQPREMFVGYYVQVSSNWQGHSSAINKMVYLDDGGSQFSAMWYEMFGSGSSPLSLYVVNQSGGSPAGIHENGAAANFSRGVWHKVEIYQKQGGPGIMRVWVDGVLYIDRSDVFTKDAAIGMVTISGIWGGIDDVKQHFDYMRFDNIHISGR